MAFERKRGKNARRTCYLISECLNRYKFVSQASTTAGLTSEDYNCQFGVLVEQIMRFRLREIRKLIGETSAKKKTFRDTRA